MIAKKDITLSPIVATLKVAMGITVISIGLVGCGSDGDSSITSNPTTPPVTTANFSETATWTVDGTKTGASCYDIDSKAAIDCTGSTWDIKIDNQGNNVKFWTNSGISGDGKGAAFYMMPWKQLSALANAQEVPVRGFKQDSGAGLFSQKHWYAYNLNNKHKIAPNNRVYLVSTDASDPSITSVVNKPVYALQIINYHDATGVTGHPTIRWIDTALPTQVKTKTIDASSSDDWVYFDLATGTTTTKAGDWQIGFKRNDVILNSGASGNGNVGGYVAKTPAGYYDSNGDPIKEKFMQDNMQASLTDLTDVANYSVSASGVPWIIDEASSELNPKGIGSYPTIDYGWYVYEGNKNHRLFPKTGDERMGALIRSAEGDSYARLYLEEIKYPNDTATRASEWVFKMDIQPKQ